MKEEQENKIIDCDTRYPIMLVHGTALSDRRNSKCWGSIPECLRERGAYVCFGKQDAWGSTSNNKIQLGIRVDEALELYSAEKINIIAHSKGGLDARALAASHEFRDKIASVTTISTPHHGIAWLSKIWPLSFIFIWIATGVVYPFFRLFYGDKRPNPYKLAKGMTRRGAEKFNLETPDQPGVYYQSYAGKMPTDSKSKTFSFTRFVANRYDGDNDGMISVETSKWGEFKGVITGGGKRGFSHADEIDFFKRSYEAESDILYDDNCKYTSVPQIYVRIVSGLKLRGL